MKRMSGYADLHIHSYLSGGGTLEPAEIILKVNEYNNSNPGTKINFISITDHETTAAYNGIRHIGSRYRIEVMPGIEIKSVLGERKVDILGYAMDVTDIDLNRGLIGIRDRKIRWLTNTVHKLNKEIERDGYPPLKEVDVEALAPQGSPINTYDVANALVKVGIVDSTEIAMKKYLKKDMPASVEYELPDVEAAIRIIKDAGGEAVIAHPKLLSKKSNQRAAIIRSIVSIGVDGIEVYHTEHTSRLKHEFAELAKKHELDVYGGSDYHGPHVDCNYQRESFLYGNIRSAFPAAEIGKSKLPRRHADAIRKMWTRKQKR